MTEETLENAKTDETGEVIQPEETAKEETAPETQEAPENGEKPKKPGLIKRIKASGFFGPGTTTLFFLTVAGLAVYIVSRFSPGFA
ncbi:MAG: hypothetical protein IKX92_03775, partial [Clostridia bacterium]|nr:hypothetical protein [Clostridia bacterium]